MLELYSNIKKYRLSQKMSQAELAKKTGYGDRSSIAKIERGDVDLPQSKIMLFARALNVTAGDLMGEVDGNSPVITPDELDLISKIRRLNSDGLARLNEQIDMMLATEKFTLSEHEIAGRLSG